MQTPGLDNYRAYWSEARPSCKKQWLIATVGRMLMRTSNNSNMRIIRLVLAAYFLFLAVGAVCAICLPLPTQHQNSSQPPMYVYTLRLTQIALAIVYALGAWTAWRERASTNFTKAGWPMTASLMSLLIGFGIPAMVYFWGDRSNFLLSNRAFAIPAAMGILGLIVFRRRRTPPDTVSTT